jgi:tetratricopeptide (TPR) repeat protein
MPAFGVMLTVMGCGPDYRQLRLEGQQACLKSSFGVGRSFFDQAEDMRPRQNADNLHDLGVCSVMVARQKFLDRNFAAAMREADAAFGYFTRAVDMNPGHQASIEGKSVALELKGQFDQAIKQAEWAAEFVGPSPRQYVWLARKLDERGDKEAAMLRYRQAVALGPKDFEAHAAMAEFLLRHDNPNAAMPHLEIAGKLNPKDIWVADQLARPRGSARLASHSNRTDATVGP